jgi:translation initiation factor 3 subunit L
MSDSHLLTESVKDFIFDLHDSVRRSQRPAELKVLYGQTFPELSQKYYSSEPWPPASAVAAECENDELFLALYDELTFRHMFASLRPTLQDKIDCWGVYESLFDKLLAVSHGTGGKGLCMLPEWAFEIMHEFVYQFQGFCQLRASAVARGTEPDDLKLLEENRGCWAVEKVMK